MALAAVAGQSQVYGVTAYNCFINQLCIEKEKKKKKKRKNKEMG